MNKIKKIIPKKIYKILVELWIKMFDGHSIKSYAQEGEDMILRRIFNNRKNGFYIDVGAHHPKRFSNTQYFYKNGWRGINIDAMPGSMKLFRECRKKDINLEIAVGNENKKMTYYAFDDPALNSFSKELSETYKKTHKLIFEQEIKTSELADILDKFLSQNQKIDFLSIDVESLEFDVLKSNNWEKYTPEVVLVEMLNNDLESVLKDEVYKFLVNNGYDFIAKTPNTVIFKKK